MFETNHNFHTFLSVQDNLETIKDCYQDIIQAFEKNVLFNKFFFNNTQNLSIFKNYHYSRQFLPLLRLHDNILVAHSACNSLRPIILISLTLFHNIYLHFIIVLASLYIRDCVHEGFNSCNKNAVEKIGIVQLNRRAKDEH